LKRSPAGASAWYVALHERLKKLADDATRCAMAPEAMKLGVDLRQAFFKTRRGRNYRLLFIIADDEARVLRVRGPGQKPVRMRDIPPQGN
jgi:hypothetical protein